MSDSGDDWEKQLEDEGELENQLKAAEEAKKKQGAFKDEDAYDSDEERKKKDAEKKAAEAMAPADGKKKVKQGGQKDYDLMFVQRQNGAKAAATSNARVEEVKKNTTLSKEAQAQQLQIAAELDITEALFADPTVNANSLNQEKDYVNFGKKVAGVLYEG